MGETSVAVAATVEAGSKTFELADLWVLILTMFALLAMMGWLAMIKGQRFDGYVRTSVKAYTIIFTVLALAALVVCCIVARPLYE